MRKNQGFTLIELIAVIVILGILSAIALPKFVNLTSDARIAKMQGAVGSVNSASALIHAKWLAGGSLTTGNVEYEGGSLAIGTGVINGYPSAAEIATVAGLIPSDYTSTPAGTVATIADPGKSTCKFTYTEATTTAPPVIDKTTTVLDSTNC